jgi:DNA-binding XRE family transcriptional regulator
MMMTPFRKYIGHKIKELRLSKNYKQQDFGDMIALSRTSVMNIESGRHLPTPETLYVICCVFDITPNDLFPPIKKANIKRQKVKRVVVKTSYKYKPIRI